ncbi:T-cell receptor gamma chain V region PT-gamma-1/2 [Sciurus carolinensis]|nr:T-cell receptor gamma chain V region PT-gamma-1/2 [Sciurus carolinensis]
MLWILTLLLEVLPPGSQTSSTLEGIMSVTRSPGSYVAITCDLQISNEYIHWYQFKEGKAPQRLLYYETVSFKLDSGIRSGKYNAYKGTDGRCKFILRNLEESDSAVYYCAYWIAQWLRLAHVYTQNCAVSAPRIPRRPAPSHSLP